MNRRHFESEELEPWIEVAYDCATGPGGQNVNKASTRAKLFFDFDACHLLSDPQKVRLRARLKTRLSRDGRLRIVSQKERTQLRTRDHVNRTERMTVDGPGGESYRRAGHRTRDDRQRHQSHDDDRSPPTRGLDGILYRASVLQKCPRSAPVKRHPASGENKKNGRSDDDPPPPCPWPVHRQD